MSSAGSASAPNAPPLGRRAGRLGHERADRRVAGVHGLHLDEGRTPVAGERHRAHGRDRRDPPLRREEGALGLARLAVEQAEGHVGAEDLAAFLAEPLGQRARDRRHAGDRRDPERDAGEKDAEAFEAAAQLAKRKAQHERHARPAARRRAGGKGAVHQRPAGGVQWSMGPSVFKRIRGRVMVTRSGSLGSCPRFRGAFAGFRGSGRREARRGGRSAPRRSRGRAPSPRSRGSRGRRRR